MGKEEAAATGLVSFSDPVNGCTPIYPARYGDASGGPHGYLSATDGLAAAFAQGDMHTPEGVRVGSTRAQVDALAPGLTAVNDEETNFVYPVSGRDDRSYTIAFVDGRVSQLGLNLDSFPC